ncbi:N-acetylated-alpha-linked acidic dipeptidase 2-like isoform X1 [Eriocheir sinensis]|uniref:N-acetylated-alpha-linked acidic dipeptidase 2-like isoform X1 n=1 Tax=Eriocheir sinensis TaxID=95602 RepID=UPI0021C88DB5|nr:N-acetylated-alpha-linked acidic dipeptidase 2-like isoform X1 [Eriocheir sinensis]
MWLKQVWVCLVLVAGTQALHEPQERETVDDFIINGVDAQNIRSNLRFLTQKQHLAGTEVEWELAAWVEAAWREQGWDEVHLVPYQVLLSYPKNDTPNLVYVLDDAGEVVWTSHGWQEPLYAPEEADPDFLPNFNAFSAPGVVTADIVYAHFGREEDFERLNELGVNVTGRVVLARYGAIFRGNIVQSAERRGAVAVLLYGDPQQYAPFGEDAVYPNTVYLPPSGAPSGSVYMYDGDPLTPFYPATDSAYRLPEEEAPLPRIPAQPISYEDASEILGRMGGAVAPDDWQGNLNLTYHLGPGLQEAGWTVKVEVHTRNVPTTIYNVVAVMWGSEEPDRYVILGNHRDAWNFGGLDPSSGTAAFLEASRVLAQLKNETGWMPRRSLVLCSWGAEEYGLIGSGEWTQQFGKLLGDRAVAYLNVDAAMNGNYTFTGNGSPLLRAALMQGAAKIPNPDSSEVEAGRTTVYDTWALRTPDPDHPGEPWVQIIGSGSDHKSFQFNLGIPSADLLFTHDMYTQPLYHTLYETFAAVDELFDQGFYFHAALTQLWAVVAVDLADAQMLPYSLVEYGSFVASAAADVEEQYGDLIISRNLTLAFFRAAAEEFSQTTLNFTNSLNDMDTSNVLVARQLNDQMMMVDRAFLDPRGLPGRPLHNHVVISPSISDGYNAIAFSGLTDALAGIEDLPPEEQEQRWSVFSHHLGAVTHYLSTASNVLTSRLW